jgi:hypothetical protein
VPVAHFENFSGAMAWITNWRLGWKLVMVPPPVAPPGVVDGPTAAIAQVNRAVLP